MERPSVSSWLLFWIVLIVALGIFFRPAFAGLLDRVFYRGVESPSDVLTAKENVCEAKLTILEDAMRILPPQTLVARAVFSRYPLNYKNELLIVTTGSERSGDHVFVNDLFLGTVTQVFDRYAVVRTIFDPRFELAVRIGDKHVDALLKGGLEPQITLISKDAPIVTGAVVYAAGADFPYGAALGTVGDIRTGNGGVFREATLTVPYNPNTLRMVWMTLH